MNVMPNATLENLPPEILLNIADKCTDGVYPPYGKPDAKRLRFYSHLARTCRRLHEILNAALYSRTFREDPRVDFCILQAVQNGNLETLKVAHKLGYSLDINGARDERDYSFRWNEIPGRREFFASPLELAYQHGHLHIIDYLLQNGASPHVPARYWTWSTNYYVLHTALKSSDPNGVTKLIKHGAYLLSRDEPALPHMAAKGYTPEVLCLFLDQNIPEVTAQALRSGAKHNIPELFYSALKKPELDAAAPDPKDGQTALHLATAEGNVEFVTALLERPEVNVTAIDGLGRTLLHSAAGSGLLNVVDILLERGVDVSITDAEGHSTLHYLCDAHGDTEIMKRFAQKLLDAGVSVNGVSSKGTPLYHAVSHHNIELALFLLANGADPQVGPPNDKYSWNLLHYALYKKDRLETRIQLVRELVRLGIDLEHDATDTFEDVEDDWVYGGPPIFYAAAYAESVECMEILLDAGADVSSCPIVVGHDDGDLEDGDTHPTLCALFHKFGCETEEQIELIKDRLLLLLRRGYSLDGGGTGYWNECPLHLMMTRTNAKMIELILAESTSKNIAFGHLMSHIRGMQDSVEPAEREIRGMFIAFREREFAGVESGGEEDHWEVEGDGDDEDSQSEELSEDEGGGDLGA